jgi:hypothetical protein
VEAERLYSALWRDWPSNKGGTAKFAGSFVPGDEYVSFFYSQFMMRYMW